MNVVIGSKHQAVTFSDFFFLLENKSGFAMVKRALGPQVKVCYGYFWSNDTSWGIGMAVYMSVFT